MFAVWLSRGVSPLGAVSRFVFRPMCPIRFVPVPPVRLGLWGVSIGQGLGMGQALPGAAADCDDQVSPLPEKAQLKYPNLGSRLNDLALRVEEGEAAAQEAADGATVQRCNGKGWWQ